MRGYKVLRALSIIVVLVPIIAFLLWLGTAR
jgi:hypothetical protein